VAEPHLSSAEMDDAVFRHLGPMHVSEMYRMTKPEEKEHRQNVQNPPIS
jgi:hypothetical protein